ncbi:MAG: DUF4391 domain-containing protein [Bacteroidales bacterium]
MNFPKSTYFGKLIPKENFYQRVDMNATIKRSFIDDIEQIVWQNKLSPDTLNVSKGTRVVEIEIFEIQLKRKVYDAKVIEVIEKSIPKHLLFVLTYQEESKLLMNYKEEYENQRGKFKIVETFQSDWISSDSLSIQIEGTSIDQVYDSFIRQVAGERLVHDEVVDIKESVERTKAIEKLEKKIADLEAKKRKEKQFNKQLQISNEIKKLKECVIRNYELQGITNH